jgi:hypothetical protein
MTGKHTHAWEPATVPCGTCAPHPAVRCQDPACPLHAHPIDVTKYGDPRVLEVKLTAKRGELARVSDLARAVYREWQDRSQAQDTIGLELRALEQHYRQVVAVHE